jgi:hypothetical protein
MSNRRKLPPPKPSEAEAAFRDELKRDGCTWCGSRTITAHYRSGAWDYGLRCPEGCPSLRDPAKAHAIGARAAERAGQRIGVRLGYRATDNALAEAAGEVTGQVVAI